MSKTTTTTEPSLLGGLPNPNKDTTTTTVPAKKAVVKKKAPVSLIPSGGSGGVTSGTKLTLPDAAKLHAAGLPMHLAKLIQHEQIPIELYNSTSAPTAAELLAAIDGVSPDSFKPEIAAGIKGTDAQQISVALNKYLGINPDGTYSEQEDQAELATHALPTAGKDFGNLGLIDTAALHASEGSQNLANAASSAEEAEALKVDKSEIYYNDTAPAAENQAALTGATSSAKYSAEAGADNDLTNWGIDTPEMNSLVAKLAASGMTNTNEILQNVRATATYKKAFEGLAEYNAVPGHVHMTESEYRTYSQSVLGAAQQYGVPKNFINQAEIGKLLVGNVSASEFQQRVTDIYSAVSNADPGVKADLQKWYGIGPSQLTAYFANPDKALPVEQRQVASAEIGDYASRVGLKGLTEQGAQQLAQQAKLSAAQGNNQLGTGVSTIEGSLLTASKDAALLGSNPGGQKASINTNTLIGSQVAGFGGTSEQAAQTDVERAEQAKAAPFESGGGFAQSEKGVTGIGSATS